MTCDFPEHFGSLISLLSSETPRLLRVALKPTPLFLMSLVPDGPNDTMSLSQAMSRMVGIGEGSSCEEGRMCRGGRMCKGMTRQHASHMPSHFFFHQQGSVHLACCPVFVSSFPPAGSPSPNVDEVACFPHVVSFSLFFLSTGQCAPCMPPCFLSFFLLRGPPPGRSTRQHASHTLPLYLSFFH